MSSCRHFWREPDSDGVRFCQYCGREDMELQQGTELERIPINAGSNAAGSGTRIIHLLCQIYPHRASFQTQAPEQYGIECVLSTSKRGYTVIDAVWGLDNLMMMLGRGSGRAVKFSAYIALLQHLGAKHGDIRGISTLLSNTHISAVESDLLRKHGVLGS